MEPYSIGLVVVFQHYVHLIVLFLVHSCKQCTYKLHLKNLRFTYS